jgi:DNA polymerase-3 subunit epsilon
MGLSSGGLDTHPEATYLAMRAKEFLARGPADPVSLIGHVCNLPGAPLLVAEHMAQAIFAGRTEFVRDSFGQWRFVPERAPGTATTTNSAQATFVSSRGDELTKLSYVVVDLETTGGSHRYGDRITEVGAVVVRDGAIDHVYEKLVNPERPIPAFISRLTHITSEMVRKAPRFEEIEPELVSVLEGNVFAAHNARFDWTFLCREVQRASGRVLYGRQICTVRLARIVLPQLPRRSLDNLARYYGVKIKNRHRAGGDALATAECLIKLLSDAADRGCVTWDDLERMVRRRARHARKRRRSALPRSVDRDDVA